MISPHPSHHYTATTKRGSKEADHYIGYQINMIFGQSILDWLMHYQIFKLILISESPDIGLIVTILSIFASISS
jgi:hypothetical protein